MKNVYKKHDRYTQTNLDIVKMYRTSAAGSDTKFIFLLSHRQTFHVLFHNKCCYSFVTLKNSQGNDREFSEVHMNIVIIWSNINDKMAHTYKICN